jgi:hypothetical protein
MANSRYLDLVISQVQRAWTRLSTKSKVLGRGSQPSPEQHEPNKHVKPEVLGLDEQSSPTCLDLVSGKSKVTLSDMFVKLKVPRLGG